MRRRALVGVVLLMDVRHPASALDRQFFDWSERRGLPCHILLTKCDKLARSRGLEALRGVQRELAPAGSDRSAQLFSATKKLGLDTLVEVLDRWFEWPLGKR